MSATLSTGPIAAYLDAPILRSEGRLFDTSIEYTPHSSTPVEEQVAAALEKLHAGGLNGDLLVFLPGAAEIRRALRTCESIARRAGLLLLPLHGDLSPEEQDRAVQPAGRPKVILSTNVAESSITIDGVTAVIDSGVARVPSDSPWTGLPTLTLQRISKASAVQRAGRAGRTRPGRVIRLYTAEDFQRRSEYDLPEIQRRELSQVLLEIRALGADAVPWFEPPPAVALQNAEALLERLGVDKYARQMARYPLHPRLARVLIEAEQRGAASEATKIVAFISAGDRTDAIDALDAVDQPLSPRAQQIERQLRHLAKRSSRHSNEDAVRLALLTGFPDRVARKRSGADVQLANGRAAMVGREAKDDLFVALDIEDRRDQAAPLIRLISRVQPEWLLDLYPNRIRERNEPVWNRTAERVEAKSALLYDEIVIEESDGGALPPGAASQLLFQKMLETGIQRFVDTESLDRFRGRVEFASRHSGLRPIDEEDIHAALRTIAEGLKSFVEVERAAGGGAVLHALMQQFPPDAERILDEVAPEHLALGKRRVKVNYASGRQPWISSRLQDFFGLRETPKVARGQVPVLVHLLAPNQRPVQVTADLAGFWDRLYPQVRRELSRRYPKHAWPEKPP
jgi:ATP-dependent helicase HrpB